MSEHVYCNVCGEQFKTSDTLETHAKCRKPSEPAEAAGDGEHLLGPSGGTTQLCSCGRQFYRTDLARQHQWWHLQKAALIHSALSRRDEELEPIIKFLLGEAPLDGLYFGEPSDSRPTFWWRKQLREVARMSPKEEATNE